MSDLNTLLKEHAHLSYCELLERAEEHLQRILPVFNKIAPEGNGASYLLPFICTSVASDGKLSKLEYEFINDLLGGIAYSDVLMNVQDNYNENTMKFVDDVFDKCQTSLKSELLSFCMCFIAVDKSIVKEETDFIKRLLA